MHKTHRHNVIPLLYKMPIINRQLQLSIITEHEMCHVRGITL
jgi:hypothetical protein